MGFWKYGEGGESYGEEESEEEGEEEGKEEVVRIRCSLTIKREEF